MICAILALGIELASGEAVSSTVLSQQSSVGHYFSKSRFRAAGYPVPLGARIETVGLTEDSVTLRMRGNLPSLEDRMVVEVFFSSGLVLALTYGKAELFAPRMVHGDARIIQLDKLEGIAHAATTFSESTISFSLGNSKVKVDDIHYIVVRFLPGFVDLGDVAGAMGGCISDVWLNPTAGKQRVTISNALYNLEGRRTSIHLPVGPQFGHPPKVTSGVKINKEFDFDGDGTKDYSFKLVYPYGARHNRVAIVYLDHGIPGAGLEDTLAVIFGQDLDLDGGLSPNEMLGMASRVPLLLGHVAIFTETYNSEMLLHLISFEPETKGFTHTIGKFTGP
jgi:hypothetical protein